MHLLGVQVCLAAVSVGTRVDACVQPEKVVAGSGGHMLHVVCVHLGSLLPPYLHLPGATSCHADAEHNTA